MRRAASAWFSTVVPSQTLGQPAPQSAGSIAAVFCGRLVSNCQSSAGVARMSSQRSARQAGGARLSKRQPCWRRRLGGAHRQTGPRGSSGRVAASSRTRCAPGRRAGPRDPARPDRAARRAWRGPPHSSGRRAG